jgi:hypothetical protein
MFSMKPINETCSDSNIEVQYLPDLINNRKMLFMLWSSGSWWHVVWYKSTNVLETLGCVFVPKTGHQTTHCHNPQDHNLNLHHTRSPIKSALVHTHTILCTLRIACGLTCYEKVSKSGIRANLHHCLSKSLRLVVLKNKFCQLCQYPTQFL